MRKAYAVGAAIFAAFMFVQGVLAQAPVDRDAPAVQDSRDKLWSFTYFSGATVVSGSTAKMTGQGGNIIIDVARGPARGWSFPLDFAVSYNGIPKDLLQQEHVPNGTTNFLAFGLNAHYGVIDGSRWGVYASGGAGLSWKDVVYLVPSNSCTDAYGCYTPATAASTWQPGLNGALGFTWRFHRNGHIRLVQETRYYHLFTPQGPFPGFNSAGTNLLMISGGIELRGGFGPRRSDVVR